MIYKTGKLQHEPEIDPGAKIAISAQPLIEAFFTNDCFLCTRGVEEKLLIEVKSCWSILHQ